MDGYRRIAPLERGVKGNTPGPAPEVLFLKADWLVVNEEYQRELSKASLKQIRKMAAAWDWSAFKAPSVARTADPEMFEVVDGQHTAIAALTNGNIHFLPCLVMDAETLAQKAKGFLGINQDRIALTKAAIYNAQVAAQDETAIAVEAALSKTSVRLLALPPPNGKFKAGETMAIGSLLDIARKRGEPRLTTLLRVLVEAQAAPISACVMRALDVCIPLDPKPDLLAKVVVVLRGQGVGRLEMIAKSRTPHGRRAYETLADFIAEMAKLPAMRMGRPPAKKGRPVKLAA